MKTLKGNGVSSGVVFGPMHILKRDNKKQVAVKINDIDSEILRFRKAQKQATAQLGQLYIDTLKTLGKKHSILFQIHQMMLEDLDYTETIIKIIEDEKVNAEYAVEQTANQFSEMFAAMDDPYMRERASDVVDISRRVIQILEGKTGDSLEFDLPVILVADDLVPSETARLDRERVLAFITSKGSTNSHTAIFARTMGIPAVVGLGDFIDDDLEGRDVFVDGNTGTVYIDPDDETMMRLSHQMDFEQEHKEYIEKFRGQKIITKHGKEMLVCANIGSPDDTPLAISGDADGIGLFRSEFLYLGRDTYPTEEEQYEAYREVAQAMDGKTVVVRTLDIGADKKVDYFDLPEEENPAMGLRAIRICLTRPDIFRVQLRALYRASAHGKIAIMFPMIISVDEVIQIKKICTKICDELRNEKIPFDENIELGIMIETPAAAVISDLLAKEVDFFSIGTNDLTQYVLAVDRQNPDVEAFCDTHHEAVMRLIELTAKNAHKAGIWVGICGELGGDLTLTNRFAEMGIDELSVTPNKILEIKAKLLDR